MPCRSPRIPTRRQVPSPSRPVSWAISAVTVISEPTLAGTIGSFYAQVDGGTLIVAQALAEPVAEAAFDELPR